MKAESKIKLRRLIENQVDQEWVSWSERHPNLSKYIDRNQLVETIMTNVSTDEEMESISDALAIEENKVRLMSHIADVITKHFKNVIRF